MRWRAGPLAIVALSMTACMGCEGPSGLSGTLPLPSPGAHPNEPAGFVSISAMDRPFNQNGELGWVNEGELSWTGGPEYIDDPTAPFSVPRVKQHSYVEGVDAGSHGNGATLLEIAANSGEVYMHAVVKFSVSWETALGGTYKTFAAGVPGQSLSPFFVNMKGNGWDGIRPHINLQGQGISASLGPNVDAPSTIPGGVWAHLEVYVKLNQRGNNDGVIKVWWYEDGKAPVLVSYYDQNTSWGNEEPGVIITGDTPKTFYAIKISGIYGGKGCCVPRDMWMAVDHWYSSVR